MAHAVIFQQSLIWPLTCCTDERFLGTGNRICFWPALASDRSEMLLFVSGKVVSHFVARDERRSKAKWPAASREGKPVREREMLAELGLSTLKLAHEIANPLNAMSTCVQLLEQEVTAQEPDRDFIEEIIRSLHAEIGTLQILLQELREIGRPLKLNRVRVGLATLAAEVLRHTLPPTADQPVQVRKDFPDNLPPVMADPEKLKQVLVNLTKNALEAMPQGGVLTLRAYATGGHICFEIQDTGVGIPNEVKVFNLFTTSKAGGFGLGLSIARQIVTAHQGTIDYTSKLGKGTTFQISLPAATSGYPLALYRRELKSFQYT
jgi:signal transduction histidine kinase